MEITSLLPIVFCAVITLGVWAIASMVTDRKSKVDERLDRFRPRSALDDVASKNSIASAIDKAAPAISKAFKPKTATEENTLKTRLANAGYQSPGASQIFLTIKMAAVVGGALIATGGGALKWGVTDYNTIMAIVVGAGLGMYLPELVLGFQTKTRKENIFLSLPDVLDLLVVCVEAGLGLDQGMRRVSEELRDACPDICSELDTSLMHLNMGRARRDVLHDLGVRTGVDDVKSLAAILIQAEKFGSSVGQALRVQSDSMRVKRMQLAEERAQQVAVKMLIPLVLFIFPGIFVVLVGPAAISVAQNLVTP